MDIDKASLRERTRDRHNSIFVPLNLGGIMAPVSSRLAVINQLSEGMVDSAIDISDAVWELKEEQRDRGAEIEKYGIEQDRAIADLRARTDNAKFALRYAVETAQLRTMEYESSVRSTLMDVKEYAMRVEIEMLAAERGKIGLAVAREGLSEKSANAAAFLERVNAKMVEADVAKNKVEAAKANIRALMAEISVTETEVKAINARVDVAMAEADRAGIEADIASYYAQAMTKQLSTTKLAVGTAEISAEFGFISERIADILAIWGAKIATEEIRLAAVRTMMATVGSIEAAEITGEGIRILEQQGLAAVFGALQAATLSAIASEGGLRMGLVQTKGKTIEARSRLTTETDTARTAAQAMVSAAHMSTYANATRTSLDIMRSTEYISG